jgi:hypothetical protein
MDAPISCDASGHPGVTLLVVLPHPDDESIATGGLLTYYSARGVRMGVVICIGGEEGAIHDPDLDPTTDRARLRGPRPPCSASTSRICSPNWTYRPGRGEVARE